MPMSLYLNWRLGLLLIGLCLIFVTLNIWVLRRTQALQKSVERYYSDLAEHASDTLGNVALVQTAMALLYRVYDPQSGTISIDGRDIRDVKLASLRRNIGVIFQEPLLFNRSVAENLRMGNPDATEADIRAAIERAQTADFIERARTLSGGERQRLSIARALLKNPPIRILDEATSALDAATEAKVTAALNEVMKGHTTFVIAHRLATVRNATRILVFDRGQIVESGAFYELVRKGGIFAALAKTQFMLGV